MAGTATAGGCDDNRLKVCIVAASESIWGIRDVSRDPPFDGDDNHPLPIILDASIGDRMTAAMMAGAAKAGGCNNDCLKACVINASEPSPSSPSLIPHGVTYDEIRLAHAPSLSPVRADNAPVANLFCGSQGVSQNKRLSLPRETSGHTPARKKHGRTTRRASLVKAQGAIQEMLAALQVDDESSDLHRPIVTPNCNVARVGDHEDDSSDNEDYHPMSGHVPPPSSCLPKQKKIEPKIILDHSFLTFLCPSTFDNQPFWKGQPPLYSDADMSTFDDQFRKQLYFNFSATRNSAKQRESRESTRASWLREIDLDVELPSSQQLLSTKRHEMSRYILEDILDCPVNSRFIVCVSADGANLERGDYYAEKALIIADEIKRAGLETESWRMSGWRYIVIQGILDQVIFQISR